MKKEKGHDANFADVNKLIIKLAIITVAQYSISNILTPFQRIDRQLKS